MMIRFRAIAIVACAATSYSAAAGAQPQQQPPAKSCEAVLASPTRDSVLLRVTMSVHAFDREDDLPTAVQLDFGDAMLAHLVLPRPLGTDVYETSGDSGVARTAHLTLQGNYAATLTADGRIVNASVTGGAHNVEFDDAVLAAMRAIDSTDHVAPRAWGRPGRNVDIRVTIAARAPLMNGAANMLATVFVTTMASASPPGEVPPIPKSGMPHFDPLPVDTEPAMPLFSFRVPVRAVTQGLAGIPGTASIRYPSNLRKPGTKGQVQTAFVVDDEGRVEPASVQVGYATQLDFARAVLDAMPALRFRALLADGCPVRALAEQPFQFYVVQ